MSQDRTYLSGRDAATAVDWQFKLSTGRKSGYWSTIPVPSNWETEGFGYYTYGRDYPDHKDNPEIGNYRYDFEFSKDAGKRYFIVFQGSTTDTRVSLNGQQVGEMHIGGYTEFKYEISDQLRSGSNSLEVEVSKSSSDPQVQSAERRGDFWLLGGIFRPVYIEEVPQRFVDRIAINAEMRGDFMMDVYTDGATEGLSLQAQVYDAQLQRVGEPFSAALTGDVERMSTVFPDVEAWSHEFPNLYSVEVQLLSGKEVLHKYHQKFGFRTFEVRDHDGFYLNGKRILLKGANMHSFRPETGRALSHDDMLENVRLMQELNFNTVRACHYPPDGAFLDLCDSLGLLVMDELTGWVHPLPTDNGRKQVKELVARDVNHPSVILWSNGNHFAHNPLLDEDFFKWDIQKRRPLKNAPKVSDIFADYAPDFDIINTTYYPTYDQLRKRLFEEDHIVLPNEALHALYDGGGGANLKTFWDAFETSKVGGGLMIWALFDEGLLRTDQGNRPDNQTNNAADGIVGPHGEREGSFYAVREILSPVIIKEDSFSSAFTAQLTVENKFTFVNLNQCTFKWEAINFARPDASASGFRTVAGGTITAPDIPAGAEGKLPLFLPSPLPVFDALAIQVIDNKGNLVYEKRLPASRKTPYFQPTAGGRFLQDKDDPFVFYYGETTLVFDGVSGLLKTVAIRGKPTGIANFPVIDVAAADSTLINDFTLSGPATIRKDSTAFMLEARNTNGFTYLTWTLNHTGEIRLDYEYTLVNGQYHYAGIGMKIPAEEVDSKRWLGEGPARIWKNRTQGGVMDVYAVDKKPNIPGQVYNQPEFEGCFAPWKWAVFYLKNNLSIGFRNDSELVLGVLNPVNGENPKMAGWHYPEGEGLYFFNVISAVGSKWKDPSEFGPDAQPTVISGKLNGSVSLYINWNNQDIRTENFKIEIE